MSLQAKSETERRAREFLRDMISDISHQLKTPLAALTMYMEIMAQEADREETVRRFTEKSMRSLERMEQLILSLLKMARLDTGNIVFEKRQCYAEELVSQAVMELSERAAREGKTILREGSPEEQVCCDPAWTKEALGNLVKNALDHTSTGGTIRIVWQRSPALMRLSVKDDGCRHPAGGHPPYFQTLLPEQAGGRQTGRGAWPFSGQKDRGGAGWQSVGGEPAGRRQRVSDLFSTVRLSVWMEVNLQPAAYNCKTGFIRG